MRILITGGAGYKGLKLAHALLEAGHEITVLDNFMFGVESALFLFHFHPRVQFVSKDIRSIDREDVAGFDVIYHLAAISDYPACEANPHSAHMINVVGTEKLLDVLADEQLLIYASTTSIYGHTDEKCTEQAEVKPGSLYAITKHEAEKRCLQRTRSIALRFATIFGAAPRMHWDLMPNDFVMRALQDRSLVLFDSRSVRTFLHLRDAIDAYVFCLEHQDVMVGEIFNVGSAALNLSKLDLANKIREHLDFAIIDSDLVDPDVRHFYINFDKIAALGYQPSATLDEGIDELVALFRVFQPTRPFKVI